eukprot:CAMPEP_0168387304 /NCGR_PEP_ID=MMETSP0228-20121227/15873_1 /TAXON_ID=133427 /ORGANISM="Protoceratium reticulatum, Strain CCCM 535 (=CCMP 1889)" /LENGTH=396 /DNA_ID=CAMNT_0008400529 /DNA_START=25 /DNA_END=1215 /DNA_ORIENTATION=-
MRPVAAPALATADLDAQVVELLGQIAPTAQSERVAQGIAQAVADVLRKVIPEVEVMGVASAHALGGTAFGVAVPEVEIIANAPPDVLLRCLQGVCPSASALEQDPVSAKDEARKIQKSALRFCTDRLVVKGSFKFRRSAFRSLEPKVTLLAPATAETAGEAVPFTLNVNCATPLYNAALLAECGQIEPRARELIVLVRRWAKDRGVCHAVKGHLPPYAWTLLVIYFLQVGVAEEGPLLPPLGDFTVSSGLMAGAATQPASGVTWQRGAATPPSCFGSQRLSVGALFAAFARFLSKVDWHREAAAVHLGRRAPLDKDAEVHIVVRADGGTGVVPTIIDPFEPGRNVAVSCTAPGLARFHEELERVCSLCSQGALLTDILDLWRPEDRLSSPGAAGCL